MIKNDLINKIKDSYMIYDFDGLAEIDKLKASMFAQFMAEVMADGIESYIDIKVNEIITARQEQEQELL